MNQPDSRPVLVTGAFGNVGRHTLRALLADGRTVVATDLRTAASEAAAEEFSGRIEVRWADLTDAAAARDLVAQVRPRALLHLAAVIPPGTYLDERLAEAINVGATRTLVDAVADLDEPCRFVFASSVAVYGSRNPHTTNGVDAETPPRPRERYGAHKVASEQILRASAIDWTVLRLGAVIFHDMPLSMDLGSLRLEALLPTDGRLHAVDGRDVARAFANAVDADCTGKTLLIGGDESTRMTQRDFAASITTAVGLPRSLPAGRLGDPTDDSAWFNVDWMDTKEAQALLDFQRHSWSQTMADLATHTGFKRRVMPLVSPFARVFLRFNSPYRGTPAGPARPWQGIAEIWGERTVVAPD